jgi:antitoxin ParD1/3/4
MSRQSISFSAPNTEWLYRKVAVEREYKSNSEAVNDLIRKAREIESIRARLVETQQAGITEMGLGAVLAEIRKELRRDESPRFPHRNGRNGTSGHR